MTIGVYGIVHLPTGRWYVGMSTKIEKRWLDHKRKAFCKNSPNSILYSAMRKYGKEAFELFILEETSIEKIDARERYWIMRAKLRGQSFNIKAGGSGSIVVSEQTRAKLSKPSPNKGKKASPELRAKLSEAHLGQVAHNKGKPQSEATKKKLSVSLKQYVAKNGPPKFTAETRAKLSAAQSRIQEEKRKLSLG